MNAQLLFSESHPAPELPPRPCSESSAQRTMVCLASCMAVQMTSYVLILPLFAPRFSQLGAGVGALGVSEMAYAVAATASAPAMGALADRIGRRPLVLGSLVVYVLTFTGYLFAPSVAVFILLRGLAGAFAAGLMPAAMGMVADMAPADRRGQWIGILSGGASFGWIAGPIFGGLLYDRWGYEAALAVAIGMATVAFIIALAGVRETHTQMVHQAPAIRLRKLNSSVAGFRSTLPASLGPLALVLLTYFIVMFAWAFIEPRYMFYAYDDLGWSSSMLGLVMSTYGISMVLGEFGLGRLSDVWGRKPVIAIGLALFSAQFLGLALFRNYALIAIAFVIAGLGNGLFDPALSASILDMAPPEHQARLLGVKSTVGSVGNILGPALVVVFTPLLAARGVFLVAAAIVFLMILVAASAGSASRLTGSQRSIVDG